MWRKPWGIKEGFTIGAGLFVTGFLLQATLGRVEWGLFAAPVNCVALVLYLAALAAAHFLRHRVYLFSWLSTYSSAVPAFAWTAALTVVMGLTLQLPDDSTAPRLPGFSQMVSQWSFVLVYIWLTTCLGLTILRAGFPLKLHKIPFWLMHLGLFVALVSATLGNADMQRLSMTVAREGVEWRATDSKGELHELGVAVELLDFTIDEYPPKLMIIDQGSGDVLPAGKPEQILLEDGFTAGDLCGWRITLEELLPMAAYMSLGDTARYTPFHSLGATTAALVTAENLSSGEVLEGWVSCGSYVFPYRTLHLTDREVLMMPDREPQRYASQVNVYTEGGDTASGTIEVNKPLKIAGWRIYQLGYDETKGKWSDVSIFELVRDPWLPAVYVGIWMLVAGAVCMFFQFGRKKNDLG